MAEVSTKPYLVRAIYEWCADNGYRPFIAVVVDERTQVPREFVRNGEIVLNISAEATNRLHIGNELLEFEARFGGVARHVSIPIDNLSAIFAQENGHGMAFEVAARVPQEADEGSSQQEHEVHDGAHELSGEVSDAPAIGSVESGAVPGDDAKDSGAAASTRTARRAGSGRAPKRARKTTLRDVSAQPGDDSAAAGTPAESPAESTGEGRRTKSRTRKPAIAAVPREEKPGGKHAEPGNQPSPAQSDRPGDDDPGPGAPPPRGKPRLTRVK